MHPLRWLTNSVATIYYQHQKVSTRINPKYVHKNSLKRGKKCPREFTKSVHEKSPSENVHQNSPILKKSVHMNSLSTRILHPFPLCSSLQRLFGLLAMLKLPVTKHTSLDAKTKHLQQVVNFSQIFFKYSILIK